MFLCHVFMQKVIVKNILDINEEFVVSKGTSLVSSFLKIITKSRSAEISQGVRMCHNNSWSHVAAARRTRDKVLRDEPKEYR